MRKGKPEFSESVADPEDAPADFSPVMDEPSFLAYKGKRQHEYRETGKRILPRASDHAYDRNVSRLFGGTIPGLPIDADAPQLHIPLTPFAQVIEQTLKRLDLNASPFLDTLTQNWPRILPPEIARATRPGKLDNGILYVCVATHIQLHELRRTARAKIKQAVLAFANGINVRDIHLMVDTAPPTTG